MPESEDLDCYDLFISYAQSDNRDSYSGWVECLVQALQDEHARFAPRPFSTFFDLQNVNTMADWEHRILKALRGARLMLAILSPAYFRSAFCKREWQICRDNELERTLIGEGIAPIYIIDAPEFEDEAGAELDEWRKDLRRRQHLDIRNFWTEGIEALRSQEFRQRLERLNQDVSARLDRVDRSRKSPTTVPPHNRNFVGRFEELRRLRESLALGRVGAVSAINGLGGVGKSALAFEYAHAFAPEYPGGRFLLNAAEAGDLRMVLAGLAPELGLTLTSGERRDPDAALSQVRQALEHRGTTLLILDNVDNPALLSPNRLSHYLPVRDRVHVLVTTRLGPDRLQGLDCLTLDVLPEADGLRLLAGYRPFVDEHELSAATQIVRRLGGHALGLEVVAVFLWTTPEVSYANYLVRLQREGLGAMDTVGREDAVKLSRHTEKLLGCLLEPTLAGLGLAEIRALEYAAFLPAEHVALPWLRALVGAEFPDATREPEQGYPDPWRRLELRLSGLRLLTGADEPQLVRIHRIVQDVLRARLGQSGCVERMQALLRHVETRGQSLRRNTFGSDRSWEVEAIRGFVVEFAERASVSWDDLLRCARAYCGLAARLRDESTTLEQWAARGEIERMRTTLIEKQDTTRRCLNMLWAATLLAEDDRRESVAAAWWGEALDDLAGPFRSVNWELPGYSISTALFARALRDKGNPAAAAEPIPREAPPARPSAGALRSTIPSFYRLLAWARYSAIAFGFYGMSMFFFLMAMALLWMPLSYFLSDAAPWFDLSWNWVAYPAGAVVFLGIFTLMLVGAPTEFLLRNLAGRIGVALAEIARWMNQAPPTEAKLHAFRQVIAFRARVQSNHEATQEICRAWTADLTMILEQGVPMIGADPREMVRVIAAVSAMEEALIDALADGLSGLDALELQDICRKMNQVPRTPKNIRPFLHLFVRVAHRLSDPTVLADFFLSARTPTSADAQMVQSWLKLLHELPAATLGKVLRASLRNEAARRDTKSRPAWSERGWLSLGAQMARHQGGGLEFLQEQVGVGAGMFPKLLALPLRLSHAVFAIVYYAMGIVLTVLGRLVRIAGRFHDPDGRRMLPVEARRVAESHLAMALRRGQGQPIGPAHSSAMLGRVLNRLGRRGLLRGRARLVLYYMADCKLLEVVTRNRPSPEEDIWYTPKSPTEIEAAQDREQLRHVLPLRPVWASACLVTALALLGSLVWLAGMAWFLPEADRWLFHYGLAEAAAIAGLCAFVQHFPRLASYRALVGVLVLAAAVGIHVFAASQAAAADVGVPGSDYGWQVLGILIPLGPLVIANILVPEAIAWWRGAPLLYPTRRQMWFGRLLTFPAGAAACLLLAAVLMVLARDSTPPPPDQPAWPDESNRGATHVVTATVRQVLVKDSSLPASAGGRAGLSRRYNMVLEDAVIEKGEGAPPKRAYTSRVVAWPRTAAGVAEIGAAGQWFIPSNGQRVRLYLNRHWVDRQTGWATFDVALPNGIDLIVDGQVVHFHESQPLPDDQWTSPEDRPTTWKDVKEISMALSFLGLFVAILIALVVFVPRWYAAVFRRLKRTT